MHILVLNGGSSSIKFSIFEVLRGDEPKSALHGELTGVGGEHAILKIGSGAEQQVSAKHLADAIHLVMDAVMAEKMPKIDAVGYRVVHPGRKLQDHQRITPEVLLDIEAATEFAPLHDPEAVQLIRGGMERFPDVDHYACFDTVFHRTMPEEATTYPLPEEYRERGVRRYGFHGLSCESIVRQMRRLGPLPERMVIAHLGSGCSVTALTDGFSIDTTMGLTPTGGVVMGTRTGDLDPGLVLYLLREQKGTGEVGIGAIESMLNHASGMTALSEMANDVKAMRVAARRGDAKALLALRVFTRSITKAIGGFCWLMGGADAIVFAGGIGEHDAETRKDVLRGLEELGIEIGPPDNERGRDGIQRISSTASGTAVFIVPAQEDLMIAVHVEQMAQRLDKA